MTVEFAADGSIIRQPCCIFKAWQGIPFDSPIQSATLTAEEWVAQSPRLATMGLYEFEVKLLGNGRVLIDKAHSLLYMSSGAFRIECKGIDGKITNLDQLKAIALQACQQLGWTQFKVASRKTLITAFNTEDYETRGETFGNKTYKAGEVDLILEGYGPRDKVDEKKKFDLGFRLSGGKVHVFCISRSLPMGTQLFSQQGEQFNERFTDVATIAELTSTLGVKPNDVHYSEDGKTVKVQVKAGVW